jgi:hypothetical protein
LTYFLDQHWQEIAAITKCECAFDRKWSRKWVERSANSADHENMSILSGESRGMGNGEPEDVESENHSNISSIYEYLSAVMTVQFGILRLHRSKSIWSGFQVTPKFLIA